MTPLIFLLLVLTLPVAGLVAQRLAFRERRAIERFAREHSLHFAPDDRFKIAHKVAQLLPSPGAADVRVYDVIYGKEQQRYHFIFSVQWTIGVVRRKRRVQRVASFSEEKTPDNSGIHFNLADDSVSRVEQYQRVYSTCCGGREVRA